MDRVSTINYEEFQRLAEDLHERSKEIGDTWELRTTPQSRSSLQANQYLVKKASRVLRKVKGGDGGKGESEEPEQDLGGLAGDTSDLMEDADVAYLNKSSFEERFVHVEYHVLHSVSYQVPVFYFNASFSNGRGLLLEDVWELLSPELISREADRWGLVTQQEHPYLGRPFYHIHPCHTAKVMGKAVQCVADGSKEEGVKAAGEVKKGEEMEEQTKREGKEEIRMKGEGKEGWTKREEKRRVGKKGKTEGGNYLITWLSTFAPIIGLECSLKYAPQTNPLLCTK